VSGGHTLGPWHVARQDSPFLALISANHDGGDKNNGVYIAKVQGPDSGPNARLIAAAPELLTSLSKMVELYTELVNCGDCGNWYPELEGQVARARTAIAKATGAA